MPDLILEFAKTTAAIDAALKGFLAILPASPPSPPSPPAPPVPPSPPPPPPGPSSVVVTPDTITTPFDTIPNFGGKPTIFVGTGNWSTAGVMTGDVVSIPANQTVTYDVASDVKVNTVSVAGTLVFSPTVDTRLRVTNLVILPGGTLRIETAKKCEIIFNNTPLDPVKDPGQYGNGLLNFGTIIAKGIPKTTAVQFAVEPQVADDTLHFATPATGWTVGDVLVIADSRQLKYGERPWDDLNFPVVSQTERATVKSVSADGLTVTLTAPLQFSHLGARDPSGKLLCLPYAGLLTHNIVFKSESASGVRGHFFASCESVNEISGCQFSAMGRTKIGTVDATNPKGRYPVHFHHLTDGIDTNFVENSVWCGMTPMPFKWGVVVHDSDNVIVDSNVVYNWAEYGIVVGEMGTEKDNHVSSNHVVGMANQYDTAIWVNAPGNWIAGNVTADSYTGFAFGDQYSDQLSPARSTPILSFADNVSYGGKTTIALVPWHLNIGPDRWHMPADAVPSVVERWTCWHVSEKAIYNYESNKLIFRDCLAVNNSDLLRKAQAGAVWYYAGDYTAIGQRAENCRVMGFLDGIFPGSLGDTTVVGGRYENYQNIRVRPPWWLNSADDLTMPRSLTIDDTCELVLWTGPDVSWQWGPPALIAMTGDPNSYGDYTTLITSDKVTWAGKRVYYPEAAPAAILPVTIKDPTRKKNDAGDPWIVLNACPEAGLTNEQSHAKYGKTFGGELPSAGAKTMPGVVGLVGG